MVLSSKQSYDKWMKRCRDDLFNYCKLNYTEYMALFDIAAFDKFKVENRMSLIEKHFGSEPQLFSLKCFLLPKTVVPQRFLIYRVIEHIKRKQVKIEYQNAFHFFR